MFPSSLYQYSSDAVSTERPSTPHILPICSCLRHVGRHHEPHRGDPAIGGAADDDQENAGRRMSPPQFGQHSWSVCSSAFSILTRCCDWPRPVQRIPAPLFVLEIWKACFTGLIESPEGTEELKWTAFTFLKVGVSLSHSLTLTHSIPPSSDTYTAPHQ